MKVSMDTRSGHMHTGNPENLRLPSTGPAPLSRASDHGRQGSWRKARGTNPRAATQSLPVVSPLDVSSDYRTAASGLDSKAGVEGCLRGPQGPRSHKRPRLEDRLKEGMAVRAFLTNRHASSDSGKGSLACTAAGLTNS